MEVSVVRDPAALEALAPDWRGLWVRDPHATVFHTPEYARVAWETELGADRELLSVQVRGDDGALVGLANLTLEPDATLRFLGNAAVTDYLGPLAAPEERERVAGSMMDVVASEPGWTRAELLCVASDTGWPELLSAAAKGAGLSADAGQHDVCPRVAVGGSYESYLASLPQKLRHEIKRKARRLEREAGPYAIRLSTTDELERDLELFFEMHRASEGHKGKFMHADMAAMFRSLSKTFLERGWLRLAWLEVGDAPWATTMSFAERGVWAVYNSAYDTARRELGPGMVLMAETIRLAAEEGCETVDLLRGDEPYKYRFGAEDVGLIRLELARA